MIDLSSRSDAANRAADQIAPVPDLLNRVMPPTPQLRRCVPPSWTSKRRFELRPLPGRSDAGSTAKTAIPLTSNDD
jgi:hypothetical protein